MSEQLLLLNPRRRRRRRASRVRRARRAVAKFFGRTRRRRLENPRRRHRRAARRFYAHRSNPRRSFRRRARRHYRHLGNPRAINVKSLAREYLVPAGIGAVGAVGLKVGWGYLSPHLPAAVQSGWGALGAQTAVVLLAGFGAGKALPRHRRAIALGVSGALTVIAYTALTQLLTQYAPNLQGLRDYTDYRIGAYMPSALPAPVPAAGAKLRGLGIVSPAPALAGGFGAYMTYGSP